MFETRNAIFRLGHFYDTATNKRVELVEGTQVCLVAQPGGFSEPHPVGHQPAAYRTAEQMLTAVQQLPAFRKAWLFAKAGTELFFGLDRKKHIFRAVVHEDLYLYNCSNWKDKTDLYLFDCACAVVENINDSLSGFEPVFGASISDLYKTAYVHYLHNQGNAARNAVTVFHWDSSMAPATKLEDKKLEIQRAFTKELEEEQ